MQGNAANSSERNDFEQMSEQMVLRPKAAAPLSNRAAIRGESGRRCVDRGTTGLPGTSVYNRVIGLNWRVVDLLLPFRGFRYYHATFACILSALWFMPRYQP